MTHRAVPPLRVFGVLALLCLSQLPAARAAVSGDDPAGHWNGTIEIPATPLKIDVDFSKKDGAWTADISIPAQNARDLPLSEIKIEGRDVSFIISSIPGNPTFKGKLADDGKTIAGTFTQGGQNFPFKLERGANAADLAKDALAGFEQFVEQARKDWKVPGVAVVIVKDEQVVFAKGFGERDLENHKPVTTQTLFAIGSCSKAFTTFLMGQLVDDGKLEWDKPVRAYIPTFQVNDPTASAQMTPRDLVTHRSGLPRHDTVWYNSPLSRAELLARLPYLESNKPFRSAWQYNNLMYLTAGVVTERVAGKPWEDSIRERIFAPLGMKRANFSVSDSRKDADAALPYEERKDEIKRMAFRNIDNMGPAGSINACVDDLAPWIIVHLNDGKYQGKPVIRSATLAELHAPQMVMGARQTEPQIVPVGYACGWMVDVYRGRPRVHHGGAIDGFLAQIYLLPEDRLGVAVLCNLSGTPLADLVVQHAIDRMLKLETTDWNAQALAKRRIAEAARKEAEKKKGSVRKPNTKPAHELKEYAGEYEHSGYGVLKIDLKDGRLEATYNNIVTPLEHWHYEVFNCGATETEHVFEDQKILFVTGMDGEVEALQAVQETLLPPATFKRKPDARLSDPAYLKRFVGDYDLSGQTIKISPQGKLLVAEVPGQPPYELEPTRDDGFNLKGLSGFHVKFVSDEKGEVKEARFDQPNGVFSATRKK